MEFVVRMSPNVTEHDTTASGPAKLCVVDSAIFLDNDGHVEAECFGEKLDEAFGVVAAQLGPHGRIGLCRHVLEDLTNSARHVSDPKPVPAPSENAGVRLVAPDHMDLVPSAITPPPSFPARFQLSQP